MKKKILLLLSLLPLFTLSQNRYVVNNMPGSAANFSNLQAAVDGVPSGSILYVMPSALDYGLVAVNKQITIYGPGYFLGENAAPNTQSSYGEATVKSIWFKPGSDNSLVQGLKLAAPFDGVFATSIYLDTVNNITVSRCLFSPLYYGAAYADVFSIKSTNCTIAENYFYHYFGNPYVIWGYDAVNLQVRNNIIQTGELAAELGGGSFGTNRDITFTNNIIISRLCTSNFNGLKLFNNILLNSYAAETNIFNQSFTGTNNIANFPNVFDHVPPGNNQVISPAAADSMLVYTLPGYHSTEQHWQIRDTSFAKTWGLGGIECGPFGNANPYHLSGIPKKLPYIYQLGIPAEAPVSGSLSVHIKAKASN